MYAIVKNNNITQYVNNPKSVVIGDVRYPAKIFELWSKDEKEAIGIYEVETDSTNFKDEKWYTNTNESYAFASFGFKSIYFSINGNPLSYSSSLSAFQKYE